MEAPGVWPWSKGLGTSLSGVEFTRENDHGSTGVSTDGRARSKSTYKGGTGAISSADLGVCGCCGRAGVRIKSGTGG